VTLPVEAAVELCGFAHTDGRVRHSGKVDVAGQPAPEEDIVAPLVHKAGEPFHIARVAEQIPAFLLNGRLEGFGAIGIGADALGIVVVCRNVGQHREKQTDDGRQPWQYPDRCLVTLCEKCHRHVHLMRHVRYAIWLILLLAVAYVASLTIK